MRRATSYTADEAASNNLVERVSPNLTALLDKINGMGTRGTKHLVMHTANAEIDHQSMPLTLELLNILIDPNLLFLLFLAGIGGLAYEVFHPGVILPGTLGAVCLILALFGFSVVPINWAGVVLIVLGVALLLAEAFVDQPWADRAVGGGRALRGRPAAVPHPRIGHRRVAVRGADDRGAVRSRAGDGGDQGGRGSAQPAAAIGLAGMLGREAVVRTPLRAAGRGVR